MKKLSAFFYRFSSGWITLAGVIVFLVFSVLTLPKQNAMTEFYSQGLGGPDTSLFYTGSQLLQMAEVYGEEGRAAFITARWGFDLAFPVIYTFFYITCISYCFKRGLNRQTGLPMLNLVPLLAFLFDLAENTATTVVMAAYPQHETWGQLLAPVFTPIKWVFVVGSGLLVFVGVILWLRALMRKRK